MRGGGRTHAEALASRAIRVRGSFPGLSALRVTRQRGVALATGSSIVFPFPPPYTSGYLLHIVCFSRWATANIAEITEMPSAMSEFPPFPDKSTRMSSDLDQLVSVETLTAKGSVRRSASGHAGPLGPAAFADDPSRNRLDCSSSEGNEYRRSHNGSHVHRLEREPEWQY